jgi:hypothetical protein
VNAAGEDLNRTPFCFKVAASQAWLGFRRGGEQQRAGGWTGGTADQRGQPPPPGKPSNGEKPRGLWGVHLPHQQWSPGWKPGSECQVLKQTTPTFSSVTLVCLPPQLQQSPKMAAICGLQQDRYWRAQGGAEYPGVNQGPGLSWTNFPVKPWTPCFNDRNLRALQGPQKSLWRHLNSAAPYSQTIPTPAQELPRPLPTVKET